MCALLCAEVLLWTNGVLPAAEVVALQVEVALLEAGVSLPGEKAPVGTSGTTLGTEHELLHVSTEVCGAKGVLRWGSLLDTEDTQGTKDVLLEAGGVVL